MDINIKLRLSESDVKKLTHLLNQYNAHAPQKLTAQEYTEKLLLEAIKDKYYLSKSI